MSRFNPHDHLVKQGWKGKGTGKWCCAETCSASWHCATTTMLTRLPPALKNGHATRPIPVVQKKTLSGIGKDRDESIPFWDQ